VNETRSIRDILDFWFLPLDDPGHAKPREIWWKSTPEFDEEIRGRFSALIWRAVAGELKHWAETAEGALNGVRDLEAVQLVGSRECLEDEHLQRAGRDGFAHERGPSVT